MDNIQKIKHILAGIVIALVYALYLYMGGNNEYMRDNSGISGGYIGGNQKIKANSVKHPEHGYTYSYIKDDSISDEEHSDFIERAERIIKGNSWAKVFGIPIKRVEDEKDGIKNYHIPISLVDGEKMESIIKPEKVRSEDGAIIHIVPLSATYITTRKVYINKKNWNLEDPVLSKLHKMSKDQYQHYVLNHELGHAIGYDHESLPNKNSPNPVAPIMYQQTKGVPSWCMPSWEVTENDGLIAI